MKPLQPSRTSAQCISCCNKIHMHSSHQDSELVTGESGLKAFNVRWQHWTSTGGMWEQEHCVSVWVLHWRLWLESLIKTRTLELDRREFKVWIFTHQFWIHFSQRADSGTQQRKLHFSRTGIQTKSQSWLFVISKREKKKQNKTSSTTCQFSTLCSVKRIPELRLQNEWF